MGTVKVGQSDGKVLNLPEQVEGYYPDPPKADEDDPDREKNWADWLDLLPWRRRSNL